MLMMTIFRENVPLYQFRRITDSLFTGLKRYFIKIYPAKSLE